MGNKVINLGITNESPTKSLRTPNEVYLDVGMFSARGIVTTPQDYESEKIDILLQKERQESDIIAEDRSDHEENRSILIKTKINYGGKIYEIGDRYRVAKDVNVRAVFNSLHNIFTWTPGERVLDPEFGSRLRKMLYEQITD